LFFIDIFKLEGVNIIQASPQEIPTLWDNGQVDAVTAWATAMLHCINNGGKVLLNGELAMNWDRPIFNVVAVRGEFARKHPDIVEHILGVRALVDKHYLTNPEQWVPGTDLFNSMARAKLNLAENEVPAEGDIPDLLVVLYALGIYGPAQQLSKLWLGSDGGLAKHMIDHVNFLMQQHKLSSAHSNRLADIGTKVKTSFLEAGLAKFEGWTLENFTKRIYEPVTQTDSRDCSQDGLVQLAGTSGTFTDGHGDNNTYPMSIDCEWEISVSPVRISWTFFSVEAGFDWVKVVDKDDPTFLVASLTGHSPPTPIYHTNGVKIMFSSDGGRRFSGHLVPNMEGFDGVYDQQQCASNSDCSNQGTCSSGQCMCNPGYGGADCSREHCLGTVVATRANSGTIRSNVGDNYYYNQDCRWQIQSANGEHLAITFSQFETEEAFDFVDVMVGHGNVADKTARVFHHSGIENNAFTIFVPSDKATIRFTSNFLMNVGVGFVATYSTGTPCTAAPACNGHGRCAADACQCEHGWFGSSCTFTNCQLDNGIVDAVFGEFQTQKDLTGSYRSGSSCSWTIKPPPLTDDAIEQVNTQPIGVDLNMSLFHLEPASADSLSLFARNTDSEDWVQVKQMKGRSAECIVDSHCSGHGTCSRAIKDDEKGLCECEDRYLNGDCSVSSILRVDGAQVRVEFVTDINNYGGESDDLIFHGVKAASTGAYPCPKNCSGHGLCVVGACKCDEDYIGLDCEVKETVVTVQEFNVVSRSAVNAMVVFAVLGALLNTGTIWFNKRYSYTLYIRLSSPMMNNYILLGCLLGYLEIVILGFDFTFKDDATVGLICNMQVVIMAISFTLAFGGLVAKTWRVFRIFQHNNKIQSGNISNASLLLALGALLFIDFIILVCWFAVEPLERKTVLGSSHADPNNEKVIIQSAVDTCYSPNKSVFVTILVGYKLFVIMFGAFLAFSTRTINIPAMNDSREIGLAIYTVAIITGICFPLQGFLISQPNVHYILTGMAIWLSTTSIIIVLFGPKMYHIKNGTHKEQHSTMQDNSVDVNIRGARVRPVPSTILPTDTFLPDTEVAHGASTLKSSRS